jgi:hypothetical protein
MFAGKFTTAADRIGFFSNPERLIDVVVPDVYLQGSSFNYRFLRVIIVELIQLEDLDSAAKPIFRAFDVDASTSISGWTTRRSKFSPSNWTRYCMAPSASGRRDTILPVPEGPKLPKVPRFKTIVSPIW